MDEDPAGPRLGWIAAVGLIAYGGVLTVAGLVVQAGLFDAAVHADERALAWHAYLWDPWFALWGAAFPSRCGAADGIRPNDPFVIGAVW
jgi:hypothetical protein